MKKSIFYILALLLVLSCAVSCKVMKEPEMDAETDPLTYWNTYIMKDSPKPFTYFSCTWNHPLHSSLSAPTSSDPEVIQYGLNRMHLICAPYFLCGLMDVMVGSMRGMGYSFLPMIVSLIGACGLRVVWIFTVFQWHRSLFTLYLSYPITWIITLGVHLICFAVVWKRKKGTWATVKPHPEVVVEE